MSAAEAAQPHSSQPASAPATAPSELAAHLATLAQRRGEVDLASAVLQVESACDRSVDVKAHLAQIDKLASGLRPLLGKHASPQDRLTAMSDYLHRQKGIIFDRSPKPADQGQIHRLLKRDEGNCLAMVLLYVSLGQRLGLPLRVVAAPGHVFVRYDDGKTNFEIETTAKGRQLKIGQYLDADGEVHDRPEWKYTKFYYRPLTPVEVVGVAAANQWISLHARGRSAQAMEALDLAVRLTPDAPEPYLAMATIAQQSRRPADAARHCDKVIELNPGIALAWRMKTQALLKLGRADDAVKTTSRAAVLFAAGGASAPSSEPRTPPGTADEATAAAAVLSIHAYALACAGQFDAAIDTADRALKLDGSDAYAHAARGEALLGKKQPDKAAASFEKAISIEKRNVDWWIGRSRALAGAGKTDDAMVALDKATALDRDSVDAWQAKLHLQLAAGKLVDAVDSCDGLIRITGGADVQRQAQLLIERAKLHLAIKNSAKAAADAARARQLGATLPAELGDILKP